MNYEGIISDSGSVTFEIKTKAKQNFHEKAHKNIKPYLFEGNEENIYCYINKFSKDFVTSEIKTLKEKAKGLNDILSFYENLEMQIEGLNQKQEAILSIGHGKSFFNSSVALLFSEIELMKLRQIFQLGYSHKGKIYVEPFPITRTVIYEKGNISNVFGWIKINKTEG